MMHKKLLRIISFHADVNQNYTETPITLKGMTVSRRYIIKMFR